MTREFLIYILFLVFVIVGVSIYLFMGRREGYYPWIAGPVWNGPWNLPTRDFYYPYPYWGRPWNLPTRDLYYPYPYWGRNKWFYDIRGPPYPYPPATLPGPSPAENTTDERDSSADSQSAGPVGLQTRTVSVDEPVNKGDNRDRAVREYERESKWWPGWARWGWLGPMFNYGLTYDVDGKLKNSRNNSIVANHAWPWAWWW